LEQAPGGDIPARTAGRESAGANLMLERVLPSVGIEEEQDALG
jgi:hypothetical protein